MTRCAEGERKTMDINLGMIKAEREDKNQINEKVDEKDKEEGGEC